MILPIENNLVRLRHVTLQAKKGTLPFNCDSCPMDGFDFQEVAKLIQLPEDYVITMFGAIGKGIKEPWSRGGQLPMDEIVIQDRFEK